SPDGRYLVTFGREEPDFSARVWDVKTGKEVQQLKGLTGRVIDAAFLPDSRRIFVQQGEPLRAPRLYDISTGKEIRRFEMLAGPHSPQGVSPDGRRVLMRGIVPETLETGKEPGADRSVRLVDVETGKELHRFDGHTAGVTSAVFLPDGKFALTGSA